MSKSKIKICNPYIPDMYNLKRILMPSFKSGQLSNFGPVFERACHSLNKYLNLTKDKDILLVSSGTVALQTAFNILNPSLVGIQSYTFPATILAANGFNSIFLDCSPKTGIPSLETIKDAINKGCTAICITCPLSIISSDLYKIDKLCKEKNVKLIIDGAATFGTDDIYNIGDIYCYSFHATKSFSIGEGGALVLDKKLLKTAKQYINFGFGMDTDKFNGINGKISELESAVVVDLLPNFKSIRLKRLENTQYYKDNLPKNLFLESQKDTVYQVLPLFSDKSEAIMQELEENNIDTLKYYKVPFFNSFEDFPGSKKLYNKNFCIPVHQGITVEDMDRIIKIIKRHL